MKTVLVTGASRGIGRATAEYFANNGWRVFAAVREMRGVSFENPHITVVQIDVDSPGSIYRAFHLMKVKFDALVNNAGVGIYGPFEAYSEKELEQVMSTNVLGLMRVTKAVIPVLNKGGVIINVSSALGRVGLPFSSVYSSSKFAIEGFSESLHYELAAKGLYVKVVEPWLTNTRMAQTEEKKAPGYERLASRIGAMWEDAAKKIDEPSDIAALIYAAATDGKDQLYYAPPKAKSFIRAKKLWPSNWFVRRYKKRLHK